MADLTTVVIAAHDEAAVIDRCLATLLGGALPGELEVIVSANGCTDDTAALARRHAGVLVVESAQPGKTGALNRAEDHATGTVRIYLDADIEATVSVVRALRDALTGPDAALVAVPSRHLEITGRPLAVRGYLAVQRRLPVFDEGLFGRGMIAVSGPGRARFDTFPDVVADDLFLDSLFTTAERVRLHDVTVRVATPLRTADLVRRLVRVRRGNAALRSTSAAVRRSDRWSWLRDVVVPRPWLAPAAVAYVAITTWSALLARRGPVGATTWGRDESTRPVRGRVA